jgi:hypothetical protein
LARDTFEFRFDRRGNIVIEDADLARRLLYLLRRDSKLVVRIDTGEYVADVLPNPPQCLVPPPTPVTDWRIRNGSGCPNMMCDCGALQLIDDRRFAEQWDALRDSRGQS